MDTEAWQRLAEKMSDISELAFNAGWMSNLEFFLWEAVLNGPVEYGQVFIDEEKIAHLKELSEAAEGWVAFRDGEEQYVPMGRWLMEYEEAVGRGTIRAR